MEYLLDTNICIYIIKQKPIAVLEKFQKLSPEQIGISTITLAELRYGVNKSSQPERNKLALSQFIIPLSVLDFDYNATILYGEIRANLEKKGTPIGPLDTLIAAQALSSNLTLVTNNLKEFSRVEGLQVENWAE